MPKNEGGLSAGDREMGAAARMHGEPLMRLNRLVRWYITAGLVVFTILPILPLFNVLAPTFRFSFGSILSIPTTLLTLHSATILLVGGMAIKFLPSSVGGNPHVYSLPLSLWSFWLLITGTLVGLVGVISPLFTDPYISTTIELYAIIFQSVCLLVSCGLLLFNLSKTMESRV